MVEDKVKLWFPITFTKGIVGLENDSYTESFIPNCGDCEEDIPEGQPYYYYNWDKVEDGLIIEIDDDYTLCEKCSKKRMKR